MPSLVFVGLLPRRQGFPDPLTSLGNFIQGSTSQRQRAREKRPETDHDAGLCDKTSHIKATFKRGKPSDLHWKL